MKENEIMIGDWVRVLHKDRGGEETVKAFRVDELIRNFNLEMGVWSDLGYMGYAEQMEPIPLTAEILEKNGFKNVSVITVGTAKMRWVSEDTRTEITIWMDDTMPMEIVKNVYYEDEVSYTLQFPGCVHDLQHALRLCGIEKEITI